MEIIDMEPKSLFTEWSLHGSDLYRSVTIAAKHDRTKNFLFLPHDLDFYFRLIFSPGRSKSASPEKGFGCYETFCIASYITGANL